MNIKKTDMCIEESLKYKEPCNTCNYRLTHPDGPFCGKCIHAIQEQGDKLPCNERTMCGFGKDIWTWIKEHGESVFEIEEVEDIMEIATRHGLVEKVAYDPEIHQNIHGDDYLDPGDQIWWYGVKNT